MKNSDEASFSYDSDDEGGDSDSDELNYFHDSPPTSTSDLSKRDNPRCVATLFPSSNSVYTEDNLEFIVIIFNIRAGD